MKGKKPIYDMHRVSEDLRIAVFVTKLLEGATIGVLVDDEPGKADRYLEKIRKSCPDLIVVLRAPGPTKGVLTLKLKLPDPKRN